MQASDEIAMANRPSVAPIDEGERHDPSITFDVIAWLREQSGLPVIVKGVLRGDDARRCLEAGASAVVVSNHGGRQLDGAVATARALPEVVAAVGDDGEVYVDGGIRSGVDVLRALALGARAVLIGRPVLWGLVTGGADGVAAVLQGLRDELHEAAALAGAATGRRDHRRPAHTALTTARAAVTQPAGDPGAARTTPTTTGTALTQP